MVSRLPRRSAVSTPSARTPSSAPRSTCSIRAVWARFERTWNEHQHQAVKPQSDLSLKHKRELISARTKRLRAIGPENTDACVKTGPPSGQKGKPFLIGYHRAWRKNEI